MNMNSIKIIFAVFSLTILSFAVQAQGTDPAAASAAVQNAPSSGDMFKDWQTMQNYLASQGIDVNKVEWPGISAICQGLKLSAGDTAYNKCGYQRAKDSVLFAKDHEQCKTTAQGALPDSFLKGRTDTLTEKDKDGIIHTYQRTISSITRED